jgi:hypothetical protein
MEGDKLMADLFTEPDIANLSLGHFCIPLVNKTTLIAKGYCNIKVENGLVQAGSAVEVGGSLYYSRVDELITGDRKQENIVYAVLGAEHVQFQYSNVRPLFNTVKGGWYNGDDRAVQFGLTGTGIIEMPIDFVYTQYPYQVEPQYLFPGTWTKLTLYAGMFFRSEGGYAAAFGEGIQPDMIKYHKHQFRRVWGNWGTQSGSAVDNFADDGKTGEMYDKDGNKIAEDNDAENQLPENRPRNYTIRIWRRMA